MIVEAEELVSAQPLTADVCIVGAGAVGIALALELAKTGLDVVLLEAGGFRREPEVQAFYRGSVVDPALHSPLEQYRERRLGGSTTVWGGRCVPFDPIDFEERPWIYESGWPISSETLAPYFPAANKICEAGAFDYRAETALRGPLKPVIAGFDEATFTTDTLERFSCPTDFGRRYRRQLETSANLRVIVHASVVEVELDAPGASVSGLDVRTGSGKAISLRAKEVVIASGGLETTRLLLASRSVQQEGIGNAHGMLGRFYMCHLAGTIGGFVASGGRDAVWHGYDIADDGTFCRRRLALRAEAQRTHCVGNFVARLHHPRMGDPAHGSGVLSALRLGQAAIPQRFRSRLPDEETSLREMARHAGNVARDVPGLVRFASHMLVKRRLAERKFPSVIIRPKSNLFSLDFHAEQEPNPLSQVRLSTERDPLGMPRLEVDWHYTREDVATVQKSLALFAAEVERSGCGSFQYNPDEVEMEMTRYGAYGGHHIGTARMGDDPRRSVVDRDCRVHGVRNLYVAGSAVFPTSSQANPTLTAVALALRLAERLQEKSARVPEVGL